MNALTFLRNDAGEPVIGLRHGRVVRSEY